MAIKLRKIQSYEGPLTRIVRPAARWGRITAVVGRICACCSGSPISCRSEGGRSGPSFTPFSSFSLPWSCSAVWLTAPAVAAAQPVDRHLPVHRRHALSCCWCSWAALPVSVCRPIRHLRRHSDLHSELLHLQAANDALAAQLFPWRARASSTSRSPESLPELPTNASLGEPLPYGEAEKVSSSPPEEGCSHTPPAQVPNFINGDLTGLRRRSRRPASAGDQALMRAAGESP